MTTIQEGIAPFWRRVYAALIDGLVLMPLVLVDSWLWENISEPLLLAAWFTVNSSAYVVYAIVLHGLYGQTLGKRLMNVKVFDVSGAKLSMKQAAWRDVVTLLSVVHLLAIELPSIMAGNNPYRVTELSSAYWLAIYVSLAWLALEFITMLFNPKRRAVHDFIAGSVVMRVNATFLQPRAGLSDARPR